jgi:hypothetical protein
VQIDHFATVNRLHSTDMSRNVGVSRDFLLQAFNAAPDRRRRLG